MRVAVPLRYWNIAVKTISRLERDGVALFVDPLVGQYMIAYALWSSCDPEGYARAFDNEETH